MSFAQSTIYKRGEAKKINVSTLSQPKSQEMNPRHHDALE
jgi:hypothetical protein